MDPPYTHQSRYVSIASSPPPSNPNLYNPQIYLPPPPPHRPPSAQLLHRHQYQHHGHPPPPIASLPVQQVSFNSHHSQFQFRPHPNPQNPYHHQRSNDFDHLVSLNNDRQQQQHPQHHQNDHHRRQRVVADFDGRSDAWARPPRILPDHHHDHFDHQPMCSYRPMDKIKNDYDTSYKLRERQSDVSVQFESRSISNSNQSAEFVPHRSHFVSDSDKLDSSSYDNHRGKQFDINELTKNSLRDVVSDWQVLRVRESHDYLPGRGSNSEIGGFGVRAFSGKRELYGSGSGRYANNRVSRESSYEYNRTPRKQVQKKSALLRIQEPCYSNRGDDELHYSGYDMKSGSFTGKDHVVFSEREVGDDVDIEGSQVDLDVSFKSNSLVAKAIVAPSLSSVVSGVNLTPKKGNTRKLMLSNKDNSSPKINKSRNSSRKLDISGDCLTNSSGSSKKGSKFSEKKVATSGANMHDDFSKPYSSVSKNSPAKIIVKKSSGLVPGTGGSTKTSSFKFAKKKKPESKVVDKFINPMAHISTAQPTEKLGEPVKADVSPLDEPAAPVLSMGVEPSKGKITSAVMASRYLADLLACAHETTRSLRHDEMGGSQQAAMVIDPSEDKKGVDSSKGKITSAVMASGHLGDLQGYANEAITSPQHDQMDGSQETAIVVSPSKEKMGAEPSKDKITSAVMASGHLSDLQAYAKEVTTAPRHDWVGGSQQAAMVAEPSNDIIGVGSSKDKITSAATASGPLGDLQAYPNEATMSHRHDQEGGSWEAAMVCKKVGTEISSCVPCVTEIKRKRSGSVSPLSSSSHIAAEVDEGSVNLETDKILTEFLNGTNFFDSGGLEGANKQFLHDRQSRLLKSSYGKESSETLLSEGRNVNSDLLPLEEPRRDKGLINTHSFSQCMNTTINSSNGLLTSQVNIDNSDVDTLISSNKQPKVQMSPSVNLTAVEEFPLSVPPSRCDVSAFSSSEGTGIHNVPVLADCCNCDKCSLSDSDNNNIDSDEINPGTDDCTDRQLALKEITLSLEDGSPQGLPLTTLLVGKCEEDTSNNTYKSKFTTALPDFSDAIMNDVYLSPVNTVSFVQSVDTTLSLSLRDFSSVEGKVTEGLDPGVRFCPNGVSIFHQSNSPGGCNESNVSDFSGHNASSPDNRKRRRVSASHPESTNLIISEISEGLETPHLPTSGVELPSNSNDGIMQPEEGVAVSNQDTHCGSSVQPSSDRITLFLETSSAQASPEIAVSDSRDGTEFRDVSLKVEPQRAVFSSASGKSATGNALSTCLPGSERKEIVTENPVLDESNYINEEIRKENHTTENTEAFAVEGQVKPSSEATELEIPTSDFSKILPTVYVESGGCEKGELSSMSTYRALAADGDGLSVTNSNDEMIDFDLLSDVGFPEILSTVPVMNALNREESTSQISDEKVCGTEKTPNVKPMDEGISNLPAHSSERPKINMKSDSVLENVHLVTRRTVSSPYIKGTGGETNGKKHQPSHSVSRIHPRSSSSVFTASKNVACSNHPTKARTWHRPESSCPSKKSFFCTVPPQNQLAEKVANFQSTSYIRKGNSLVRKAAPVASLPQATHGLTTSVYRLNSSGISESKKRRVSENCSDITDLSSILRKGRVNAPLERPRTPPLPVVSIVPNCATNSTDCTSVPLVEPLAYGCSGMTSDSQKLVNINVEENPSNAALKSSGTPLNQTASVNLMESQDELNDRTLSTSSVKRITYLKRKSNQLIAASNDCDLSVHNPDKTQVTTSDGYYKRRKNQLIRTPLESHKQTVSSAEGSFISEREKGSQHIFRRISAVKKIRKPLRFPLVWTLNSMQSSKSDGDSSYRQKVVPSMLPWKRTAYWKRSMQDSVSIFNRSSLSAIGRKLLLLRKRETVYTRSNHGFSLIKSKVLGVGGSSLKWSKSIENRSKKANKEATLAVATVEKKRQQNGLELFASETKKIGRSCRDRIFRIGSVRYKMDSSRRTLQRISDDDSSCAAGPNSENNAKKTYIPKRLVIGTDEYVRIGNGNQLIRDPKKRARVLASEKVRWSLHTARLRLARKRKYCQFFTRFGKCNKDDGKCPYIHDPSKIAVCTKFLNGLCFNGDCKLTHKVIPDRMPDCSFFLQGLCTNKKCPYRHVHVNPNASTCEGFLKGYCADGNECRKKHSCICPTFEATGSCPLGSKCKLHHPKSRLKGKKSRWSRKTKNTHGRYFGTKLVEDSEPQKTLERPSIQDISNLLIEGELSDYIGLDHSDEDAGEAVDTVYEPTTFSESDASDLELDVLDECIKPIRLMDDHGGSFSSG